ncbi:hypothetical protein D9M71_777330 [compost metagenome]
MLGFAALSTNLRSGFLLQQVRRVPRDRLILVRLNAVGPALASLDLAVGELLDALEDQPGQTALLM